MLEALKCFLFEGIINIVRNGVNTLSVMCLSFSTPVLNPYVVMMLTSEDQPTVTFPV